MCYFHRSFFSILYFSLPPLLHSFLPSFLLSFLRYFLLSCLRSSLNSLEFLPCFLLCFSLRSFPPSSLYSFHFIVRVSTTLPQIIRNSYIHCDGFDSCISSRSHYWFIKQIILLMKVREIFRS